MNPVRQLYPALSEERAGLKPQGESKLLYWVEIDGPR